MVCKKQIKDCKLTCAAFFFGCYSRNYAEVALGEGFLGCRRCHSFLHNRYFSLLFFRVNESNHRDAAEQTDLPILTRSASESSTMRRPNSSTSNGGVSTAASPAIHSS